MSWADDKSGNISVTPEQDAVYCGKDGEQGNAIYSKGGNGSWQFKVKGKEGAWIGVSSPKLFGPGYQMKGLFYGGPGNLSDGGSLVMGNWGPRFGDGDVVVMKLEQTDEETSLAYSLNGVGLGTAFSIKGYKLEELCPAVSLDTAGQSVSITEAASTAKADFEDSIVHGDGIEGDWEGRYGLSVSKAKEEEEGIWRLSAQVDNSISCLVKIKEGETVEVKGGAMMTRMMSSRPDLEDEVVALLESLQAVKRDGDGLVLEGKGGGVKREVFKRAARPGPADKTMVNWMN